MSKPNILLLITDQLTWRALPYYGNTYAKTPNIDRICKSGAGFDACYCTFPMCLPSRASFWTGLYPHETKVLSNGRLWPVEDVPQSVPTLGSVFAENGYRAVHFGKTHDAGTLRGFETAPVKVAQVEDVSPAWPVSHGAANDRDTAQKAVQFLKESGREPFVLALDFVNPHDICNWVGSFEGPHEDIDPGVPLPELPENFWFDDIKNRPIAVQYICCTHKRQAQAAQWTPENFRHYLAAYYHFIARVDAEIGLVLDALDKRPDRDNTLIVFFADHGDSMAARRRVTKHQDLYEEVTRVPFIFSGPGVVPREKPISGPVSLLDLFPTLCAFAGIAPPPGLRGIDLTGALRGGEIPPRDYVVSQFHTEWGFTVSPARMIRDARYKYTHHIEDNAEELFDLENDPFEKVNQAKNAQYAQALTHMRALFERYLLETDDSFLTLPWDANPGWRTHELGLGYENHRGPAAPDTVDPRTDWSKIGKRS